jgi:hypothetical protein
MGFKAVWGFDPEEVERASRRLERDQEESCELEVLTNAPRSFEEQVYVLRRLFRL